MKFYSNNLYSGSPILGEGPVAAYGGCMGGCYGDIEQSSISDLSKDTLPPPPPEEKKSSAGTWIVLGLLGTGLLVGGYFIFR